MKIFNAMFSKVNGGLEQVFLSYNSILNDQGIEIIPIIHPDAEILLDCPPKQIVLVHNFNQYDWFAILRLRKLIKKESPECIITHGYRAYCLFKKTKLKIPTVSVCHVKSHYTLSSDAIIALTEGMKKDIMQLGRSEKSIFVVPNMIQLPQDRMYKKLKNSEIPTIGVCGRFAKEKGMDIFIKALAELKLRNIRFKAQIAGDGKEKASCQELIYSHNLSENVTLLGWINDTDAFYNSIDIFCLPSREETFGLVILESMKHALPMVLTDLPPVREIVGDSESALFFSSEDPISLANALQRIIENKALAEDLSYRAFERVEFYSAKNIGPILEDALRQIRRS